MECPLITTSPFSPEAEIASLLNYLTLRNQCILALPSRGHLVEPFVHVESPNFLEIRASLSDDAFCKGGLQEVSHSFTLYLCLQCVGRHGPWGSSTAVYFLVCCLTEAQEHLQSPC